MWEKEKGILLGAVRHNDKSCVARIFTENNGYVPFIFHTSSTTKGVRRNTLLQPLTLISFEIRTMPNDDLQHLKDPVNMHPFTNIPFNPVKSGIALFLGEFLTYALKEERTNEALFKFLEQTTVWMDESDNVGNIHLFIMLKVALHLGISPNWEDFKPGYVLDMRSGTFSTELPSHQDYMVPEQSWKTVCLLQCGSASEAAGIPMTGTERTGLLKVLNDYFRLHIPGFPILKSIEVLQAVFS